MQPDPVFIYSLISTTTEGRIDYYLGGNALDILNSCWQFAIFILALFLFFTFFDFIFQFFN